MTCALIVKNLDAQYLRFLVVLQHSVGVEGGSIIHLFHIRPRLLTLTEIKSLLENTSLCGWNRSTARSKLSYTNLLTIWLSARLSSFEGKKQKISQWCFEVPSWQQRTLTRASSRGFSYPSGKALILIYMIFIHKLRRRDFVLMGNQEKYRKRDKYCTLLEGEKLGRLCLFILISLYATLL